MGSKASSIHGRFSTHNQIQDCSNSVELPGLHTRDASDCNTSQALTPNFRKAFGVTVQKGEDDYPFADQGTAGEPSGAGGLNQNTKRANEETVDKQRDQTAQVPTAKQVQSRQFLDRLIPFRWIFSEEQKTMSDKSEKDNSSVEMALEADPNMPTSRPDSVAENPPENGKTDQKNVPIISSNGSSSSLRTNLSHQPATPVTHTPRKNNSKANMTVSSATAASLNLATPTTIGSIGGAAMLRPVKKKVVELECQEIRWHYKKPGESKWTPFRGYDSMVLEVAYRASKGIPLDKRTIALGEQLPQTKNVIVLDNLFEWNPDEKADHVTSVYWKDESMKIRRGSWFYADTMQPVAEELAEVIEKHHLEKFRNQMIPDSPVFSENEVNKKPVLTMLKWEEHDEVRWNSVIDVSFYNNTKANRLFRFVTRGKGVFPLKRGFSSEASIEEGMPNFSDLILVVHGIGQKGYENLIAKNTTQIREVIDHLMDKYHSHEKRRPMILPIEWRSSLVLDDGLTDKITLPRMPQVRSTLNSIAMDIMYYQSPLYRTEIVNGVIGCLNVTYTKFVKNNPNFNGPVSIFAHSLGSVIAYDIITNWSPLLLYDEFVTKAIEHRKNEAEDDEQRKLFTDFYECRRKILEQDGHMQEILLRRDEDLKFKVKNLFCIGSPLGVFVIMRGANAELLLPKKEQCERIYNIFHPYDPVAYRLEPMYHENYKNIRPIKLFTYNEVNRDYNKLGFDCHRSYLKKIKKALKKEAAASGEKTLDSDEKRKGEEEEDEDSDSGDCSSIHSPDCYSGPSPRSESPVGPEDIQENLTNGVTGNASTPLKVETQSRWWRFGSTTGEKKIKEEGVKEKEEKPEPITEVEKKEEKVVLSPAEQLIEGITQDKRVPYRIDFQLQTSLTDKSYWSVLKSHFGYWTNYDVTAFLINQLYPPVISEASPKV